MTMIQCMKRRISGVASVLTGPLNATLAAKGNYDSGSAEA